MDSTANKCDAMKHSQSRSQLWAWLQVVGSFFLYMNTLGLVNSYGAFQTYYATRLIPDEQSSKIAWIGSMQAFLLFFTGFLIGPLLDAGYLMYLLTTGTSLIFFGLVMTSLCSEYYQLMLAQGIVVGLGMGCLFLPSVSIVPQWFDKKQSTMCLGIIGAGSAVGGVFYPVVFKQVLERSGFGWATRSIAFINIGTNLVAILVLRMKTLPPSRRDLVDLSMFREMSFKLCCLLCFFGFAGLYIPIFFLEQYAITYTTTSSKVTEYIVPIIMAGSLPGRLVPNILALRYGVAEVALAISTVCTILCFCWIPIKSSTAGIIVFSLLYGFASGGFTSLTPPLIINLAPNMNKVGTRIGMCSALFSFGILMGNPVAGAMLSSSHQYTGLQCFSGALLMVSTLLLALTMFLRKEQYGQPLSDESEVMLRNMPPRLANAELGNRL